MNSTVSSFTVFFEGPFWVGVYERLTDAGLEACKVTFGSEPKDYEVYAFMLRNWGRLRFGPPVPQAYLRAGSRNPKRMQRQIQKQLQGTGVGTKAQQALALQREQQKQERRSVSRAERDAEKDRRFGLRQQKKREKHRGH